jgi:sortase A
VSYHGVVQPRTTRQRALRRVADLLLVVGGLTLAFPFWSAAYASLHQHELNADYTRVSSSFATAAQRAAATLARSRTPAQKAHQLAALFAHGLKPGEPIGHLTIPRLGFDRIVVQGARGAGGLSPSGDTAFLRGGPVHYAGTPLPGAGEPFAVAGHRTTYGAPFYRLDALRRGDLIVVATPYGRFTYRVARLTTVLPSDVGVLYDRGYGVVLTTCTPRYSASHRLVVWATAGPFTLK